MAEDEQRLKRIVEIIASARKHMNATTNRDLPINGGTDPAGFAMTLTQWLATDAMRRDARVRYLGCLAKQNRYDVDRLVGAANMFDILPKDALPEDSALSSELVAAREIAQEAFQALPASVERNGVLNALGRLGQSSLKRKIRHRAETVLRAASRHFPELLMVVEEAVNCRNHYVHGSKSRIDFWNVKSGIAPFLTDTLEFVFGASEFIEAGWDLASWRGRGTTMSHPWGVYAATYRQRLATLKDLRA